MDKDLSMLPTQIRQSVEQAIAELLAKDSWRQYEGEATERLVSSLRHLLQVEHIGLCSSGTAALEIILRAAKIAPDDEVLMAAYDYPGTFWAIERMGARPVLVDISPSGWSLDIDQLELAYEPACRALVVSHLHGQLQPINEIRQWCQQRKILLIEDACQAIGATFCQTPIGAWGDASFISFGGGKVLSAGRGGAFLTNDSSLAQRARIAAGAGSGPYAMSQLQAAAVSAQLNWLDAINACCRHYFKALNDELIRLGAQLAFPPLSNLEQTAFYQAGWLVPAIDHRSPASENPPLAQQLAESLNSYGTFAGVGFPGFFRRSSRRCRTAGDLHHTRSITPRTLVLHHRLALEGKLPATAIAAAIRDTIAHAMETDTSSTR